MPKPQIVLEDRDHIVTAWAQPGSGPGWHNHPIWYIVQDGDGNLRKHCLQPEDQTAQMTWLYNLCAAANSEMVATLNTIVKRKRPK